MGQRIVSMRGRNRRVRFWALSVAIGILLLGVLALPCRASEGVGQESAQTPSFKEILGDRAPSPRPFCLYHPSQCAPEEAVFPFRFMRTGAAYRVLWMASFRITASWAVETDEKKGPERWLAFRLAGFTDDTVAVQAVYLPCSPDSAAYAQSGVWKWTPDQLGRLATLIQTTEIHSRDMPELHDLAKELIELRTEVFPEPVIIVGGGSIEGLIESSSGVLSFSYAASSPDWSRWAEKAWRLIVPRVSASPVCPPVPRGVFHDVDDEDDWDEDWDEDWTDEAPAPEAGQPKAPRPPGR